MTKRKMPTDTLQVNVHTSMLFILCDVDDNSAESKEEEEEEEEEKDERHYKKELWNELK